MIFFRVLPMSHHKLNSSLLLFTLFFSSFLAISPYLMHFSPLTSQENQGPAENQATLKTNYNWTKAWLVSISSTTYAYEPAVAVDAKGNVHIVWYDASPYYDGNSNYDIVYRRWNATTGNWGGFTNTTDLISKISSSDARYPDIAVDGKGNIHIVWQDYTTLYTDNSGSYDIFYSYWNVTTKQWRGHTADYDFLSPNSTSTCGPPAIAVDAQGNVHVVWADYSSNYGNDNAYDIVYRCWNATKNVWGKIENVSTEATLTAENPSIAVDSGGNVHVAWEDTTNYVRMDGTYDDIAYKFRNATTGLWRGRINATDEISIESTYYAYMPVINVDALGKVNIVWYDNSIISGITDSYSDYDIFYKYWNGTRWTGHVKAIDVMSDAVTTSYSSYTPAIASDNGGNLYVVWRQTGNWYGSGGDDDIVCRIWNVTTTTWMVPVLVSTESTTASSLPDIAADTTGAVHVVWQEYISGSIYKIHYKKTMTTPPVPTVLAPISPNPNPNYEVELSWQERISATQYYIYRNTSFISSVVGLTPIAMVSGLSYTDKITQNGTFYYVIVAANLMGNTSISNCQNVTMSLIKGMQRITITSNADFILYASKGNGSAISPWIIEGNYINGVSRTCILISGTTDYFILRNSTVFNGVRGIQLKNVINGKLINNTARFCKDGIEVVGGQKNQLLSNKAYSNTGNSSWTGNGFLLNQTTNNWLDGNQAFNNRGSQYYGGNGFLLYASDINNLTNNIAYLNVNTNYTVNTCGTGFLLQSADNNNLRHNTAYSNRGGSYFCGIGFFNLNGGGNILQENIAYNHTTGDAAGIYMRNTNSNNKLINNTLYKNEYGVDIIGGSTETLNYNKLFSNVYGAELWGSGFTIYKNTVWNNSNGIYLWVSYNYIIANNTVYNNTNYGFSSSSNSKLEFYNNTVYKNGLGIDLGSSDECILIDNVVRDNTGRGCSGYGNFTRYFRNTIYRNGIGIYVGSASYSSYTNTNITLNLITNNREGIHLQKGYNTTIRYNRIYNNTKYSIYLDRSNLSSITWNDMLDNGNFTMQVNSVNNLIQSNAYFRGTTLYTIVPNPVIDGWVRLNWQSVPWATYYLIYRKYNAPILYFFSLATMTPVLNVTGPPAVDSTVAVLGNYSYVVVAGNATCWTSISNNQWVIVSAYPKPATPVLDAISPSTSYNGQIALNWNDAQNATRYYVYKHTSTINAVNIGTLSPIAKVTLSTYTDNAFINGTFYYAIVAGNAGFNSSVSNCQSVLIQRQPVPSTPSLTQIVPNPDYDGVVKLDWADTFSTTKYYIYRDTAPIIGLTGRIPYATVTQSNYTNIIAVNTTFYYVVVAGNLGFNSSMSVCRNVTVILYSIPGTPILSSINPALDYDGVIQLSWSASVNTVQYYIYRELSSISSTNGLVPKVVTTQTTYTDVIGVNGTFYYAIIAVNPSHNSTPSNNGVVEVKLYSIPSTPVLNPIMPNVDYDGIIHFNWTISSSTDRYYVYRNIAFISEVGALSPIAMVTTNAYTDVLSINNTYYYAIVSGNPAHNSTSCSNCHWVIATIIPPPGTPFLEVITPSFDGLLQLNWNDTINTDQYYVYKDTSFISSVASRIPYGVVTQSKFIGISVVNGTFFFVVVAGNSAHNGSISNCQSIIVTIYPLPNAPTLSPIVPAINTYGIISLNWTDTVNTLKYYVYKSNSAISDASLPSLLPLAVITQSEYSYLEMLDGVYYYAIVSANPTWNSSCSNCQNVTVNLYNPPGTPHLDLIRPNPDYDGTIQLEWGDAINATKYYIYRNTLKITNINSLTPRAIVSYSNYTDVLSINTTYYYVIVAGNNKFNSSLSNCENVTIERYPVPSTPTLNLIVPTVDYDGIIKLNWSDTLSTIRYYIYKDVITIVNPSLLVPLAVVTQSNYTDVSSINGTFYYVIVAGNLGFNSSISECRSVKIEMYPLPTAPILLQITPLANYDGVIQLNWSDTANTIRYYVYRDENLITPLTINSLTPIEMSSLSELTNIIYGNGTFYYCIVAGNPSHNSSLSNCRSVSVMLYSVPSTPTLESLPSISYNGIVHLDWSDTTSTTKYYVFRDLFFISNPNLLKPIAIVSQSEYTDVLGVNGTYYYAVLAGNPSENSTLSSCLSIIVQLTNPPTPPQDYTWLIIVIVIGACAAAAMLVVVKVRSKPKRTQMVTQQFTVVKEKLKGIKSEWKENLSIEDKIRALQRNFISIEEFAELSDAELSGYFNQAFTPIPIKLIEFLQRLDAPLEDKMEIIAEFNNLSEEQKQEYLKELNEL